MLKNILLLSVVTTTILFAGPPPPPKAKKAPQTTYECINNDRGNFELIVQKSIYKNGPIILIIDGEQMVVQDMGTYAMFEAVLENKSSGKYKGEDYYTIGAGENLTNCSKK